jgi:probable HAF family extracellular repeat protein
MRTAPAWQTLLQMSRVRWIALTFAAVIVPLAAALLAAGGVQAETGWRITDLGTLGGASQAANVNERGQVVGWSDAKGGIRHAFVWSGERMRDLGVSGEATAINDRGQVVGAIESVYHPPPQHAFLWSGGKLTDLGCGRLLPAPWTLESVAVGLNGRGQVAGFTGDMTEYAVRAALWHDGKSRRLGTLPGRPWSRASAINERGDVVGTSYALSEDLWWLRLRAFVWRDGKLTDLGTLPGDRESEATGVNDRGRVIGISYTKRDPAGEVWRGFVWQSGTMRALDFRPAAINASGQIVGSRLVGPVEVHGVLWQNGRTTDLGPLWEHTQIGLNARGQVFGTNRQGAFVWQNGKRTQLGALPGGRWSEATAINDRGQVVGWSTGKGRQRAVLWTPR